MKLTFLLYFLFLLLIIHLTLSNNNHNNNNHNNNYYFNPNVLLNKEYSLYINKPLPRQYSSLINSNLKTKSSSSLNTITTTTTTTTTNNNDNNQIKTNTKLPIIQSNNLLYKGIVQGNNSIIGLALYKNFYSGFIRLVNSLRYYGYNGHIILGVNPNLPKNELEYLKKNNVTLYGVEISECHSSAINNQNENGIIRGKCSTDIPNLKLEWGRYEMARRWLQDCKECTGWSMIIDTRDIFFQDDPFRELDWYYNNNYKLLFIEEISPYTAPTPDSSRSFVCGNPRNYHHVVPCYGEATYIPYQYRPVLNSGTIIGIKDTLIQFLNRFVIEFYNNNNKSNHKCKSPSTTDQWTMNWLYYNGQIELENGDKMTTIPWGIGPVLTAGKACITKDKKAGATDIIKLDQNGFIINNLDNRISPAVHQFDRCYPWIEQYFKNKSHIFH